MSDPLTKYSSGNLSEFKFARLHSPKMKSVYWKYFGFPTNESDRIITKQNVVCMLCNKVLTNHGNTTNLRAHLQHRHKDLFRQICSQYNIHIPPRRSQSKMRHHEASTTDIKTEPSANNIKIEFMDNTQDSLNAGSLTTDDPSMLYETVIPVTYDDDDDDVVDTEQFTKVELANAVQCGMDVMHEEKNIITTASQSNNGVGVVERKTNSYHIEMLEEVNASMLQDALVNLILFDMRNIDTLYDPGMTQFVRSLSGSIAIPAESKIECIITEMHNEKFFYLSQQLKAHTLHRPYSLGLETWINAEQKHYVSIYFNYITDSPENCLLNQLYCTHEYNKYTTLELILQDFNFDNCVAVLVNYHNDDMLKAFLQNKNIPIILSYDFIVDKCLRSVYSIPTVSTIIEEIKDVIMRYSNEICSKDLETPILNDDFPWTYFDYLKFFCETVSWPDDLEMLVTSAKVIVNVMTSLATTLDTLKDEQMPPCSMVSPITSKIIERKLDVRECDDDLTSSVKSAIIEELQRNILEDDHLTIAALLDPRFHRLTDVLRFDNCVSILHDTYQKINNQAVKADVLAESSHHEQSIETGTIKLNTSSSSRRSNLELFFDLPETSTAITQNQGNIEKDLKRYRNEVFASLDESPFSWWSKMGQLYGSLRKLAEYYECIPAVVNINFKKTIKQQIQDSRKRFLLTGNMIDPIMFLHHVQTAQSI